MLESYDDLTNKQYNEHDSELEEFEGNFNNKVDAILSTLSEQSDSIKQEIKSFVSREQDDIKNHLDDILTTVVEKSDNLQGNAAKTAVERISILENEIIDAKDSLERTSQQITSRIDSAQKYTIAEISTMSSNAKSKIVETQDSTVANLEIEAKDNIKKAEQVEKLRKDLISRLERLERNLETIKDQL
jgi:methionyl-tRNA synthetase